MTELLTLSEHQQQQIREKDAARGSTDDWSKSKSSLNSGSSSGGPNSPRLVAHHNQSSSSSTSKLSAILLRSFSRDLNAAASATETTPASVLSLPRSPSAQSTASMAVSPVNGAAGNTMDAAEAERADENMLRALKELFVCIHNQQQQHAHSKRTAGGGCVSPKPFVQHLRRCNGTLFCSLLCNPIWFNDVHV